jgi:ADP-ribosylglycohydrolase
MATGVALAIQHTPRLDLLDQMARAAEGHSRTTAAMIRTAVAEAHDGTAPGVTLDRLRGWAAHEAIAAAAYVFARHPRDVRQALIEAANTPGDSDSIACMTGALVGAYNGAEAIDADWTEHLERAQELRYLALDLLERT